VSVCKTRDTLFLTYTSRVSERNGRISEEQFTKNSVSHIPGPIILPPVTTTRNHVGGIVDYQI
jgi:hypothetical protein